MFELCRNNKSKIGLNSNENKSYHVSKQIVLEKFNWNYSRFKKHMKIQFLKFGNT